MNQIGNMKQEETTTKDVPFYEANFVLWLCILCVFALLYKMFHALLFRLFDSVLTMFGSKTDTQSMEHQDNSEHFMKQHEKQRMDHFMKQTWCFGVALFFRFASCNVPHIFGT